MTMQDTPAKAEVEKTADSPSRTPAKRLPPAPPRVTGDDREFLPAAVEILETPAAPRNTAFMMTICAFAAGALTWSYFGKLDIHATAWGKVESSGRSKVVQPLEPGKIAQISVSEGTEVQAGDLLVALDDSEAKADATATQEAHVAAQAEAARRRASIDAARAYMQGKQLPPIVFDGTVPEHIRLREQSVFDADRRFITDTLINLDRQMNQREATIQRLEMSIKNQLDAIKTAEERVGVRESSLELKVGTKINLFDARESLQRQRAQLASDRGQQNEQKTAIDELESQKSKVVSSFVADNEGKLADALRRAEELSQQRAKAAAKLLRTRLTAPIDGAVQQMSATTIGQVVTTGQQLMSIAPRERSLQVEVFVSNADIGFVHVGQRAEVKIDAFPFTRFGTVPAQVVQIAADAIEEQEAKRRQANAITSAQVPTNSTPGQPQVFVFPVRLELEQTSVDVQGRRSQLLPGMTVTAEIKTDQRRIIEYLLSPIAKITSEAMRER